MKAGLVVVFSGQGQDAVPCLVCDPILLAATIEHQAGRRLGDAGQLGYVADGDAFARFHCGVLGDGTMPHSITQGANDQ